MHLCDLYCDCYARSPGSISKFNLIPACTTYTVCLVQNTPNYLVCNLLCTISNKSTNQMQQFSQVYYLTFMHSSTCFGRPHAHHQKLNNCSSSLWFTVGTWW
jgi:hypothetical protein